MQFDFPNKVFRKNLGVMIKTEVKAARYCKDEDSFYQEHLDKVKVIKQQILQSIRST